MNDTLAQSIIHEARSRHTFLCSVESCTGGLIANLLTDVPGSSDAFWGGFVAYDNSAKESLLHVPRELLETKGAVSSEVAQALAQAGLDLMRQAFTHSKEKWKNKWRPMPKTLISISTTGIAGPTGGSLIKPIGLCFVGLSRIEIGANVTTQSTTHVLEVRAPQGLTRDGNKKYFAQQALNFLATQQKS